jgi:hypothetical protein
MSIHDENLPRILRDIDRQTARAKADGGLRYRKLRIAWSVGCAIACLLLVVLWVRSYWWSDKLWRIDSNARYTSVSSTLGTIQFACMESQAGASQGWNYLQNAHAKPSTPRWRYAFGKFEWLFFQGNFVLSFPCWLPILFLAAAGPAPMWLRWHFSLRTLLIATTLVALVLGLIVWLR